VHNIKNKKKQQNIVTLKLKENVSLKREKKK